MIPTKTISIQEIKISNLFSNVLVFLIFIYFFLSVALVRFMLSGIPVRSIIGIFIFLLITFSFPALIKQALLHTYKVLIIIFYAALIGIFVSLFNDASSAEVIKQIIEIHIQAIIGLLTGYSLCALIGPKKLVFAFLTVVLISGAFAILQALHIDIAWSIRESFQKIQQYDAETLFLSTRTRAMGLSFSPVHIATQICLAFIGLYTIINCSENNLKIFTKIFMTGICVLGFLVIAFASGNRSPILGILVFIPIYMIYFAPRLTLLSSIILIPLLFVAGAFLLSNPDLFSANSDVRVLRAGDKSSEGREALRAFGWLLFSANPFGYGLTFNSLDHVNEFWGELTKYDNPETALVNALHNYYLNILLKYGIMILPVALYTFFKIPKNLFYFIGFIPYIVHIYFHNDGPLQSDFFFWYILPIVFFSNKKVHSKIS